MFPGAYVEFGLSTGAGVSSCCSSALATCPLDIVFWLLLSKAVLGLFMVAVQNEESNELHVQVGPRTKWVQLTQSSSQRDRIWTWYRRLLCGVRQEASVSQTLSGKMQLLGGSSEVCSNHSRRFEMYCA